MSHFVRVTFYLRHFLLKYISTHNTDFLGISLKVFLVTGGLYSATTEIFEGKNWKVLPNGNLPGDAKIVGLALATVYNKVFSFMNLETSLEFNV